MEMSTPPLKRLLMSDNEAAHVLNVHKATVRRMGDQGKLTRVKVLNKTQYTAESVYRAAGLEDKAAV
jgi:excisionase family DNA binding protein